jgi:hypothetical protein
MKKYICAARTFDTIEKAIAHAEFILKISGFIVAIEEIVSPL